MSMKKHKVYSVPNMQTRQALAKQIFPEEVMRRCGEAFDAGRAACDEDAACLTGALAKLLRALSSDQNAPVKLSPRLRERIIGRMRSQRKRFWPRPRTDNERTLFYVGYVQRLQEITEVRTIIFSFSDRNSEKKPEPCTWLVTYYDWYTMSWAYRLEGLGNMVEILRKTRKPDPILTEAQERAGIILLSESSAIEYLTLYPDAAQSGYLSRKEAHDAGMDALIRDFIGYYLSKVVLA